MRVAGAQINVAQAAVDRAACDLERTRLTAPGAGRVVQFEARIGDHVAVGRPVLAVALADNWRVFANVTERHLPRIAPGQAVLVMLGSAAWRIHRGTVRSLGARRWRCRGSGSRTGERSEPALQRQQHRFQRLHDHQDIGQHPRAHQPDQHGVAQRRAARQPGCRCRCRCRCRLAWRILRARQNQALGGQRIPHARHPVSPHGTTLLAGGAILTG
ncbi:MAG: HlyD family efflux transporter periplasmic adaptor subunit [Acetobacteraceae bacterium]|nr:HlyD family efflux transporter periplasmic adaptor subunit [Acetobacteraceae bacterium]